MRMWIALRKGSARWTAINFFGGRVVSIKSLKRLSNNELIAGLTKVAMDEFQLTLKMILHIIELERRNLVPSLGCSSTFAYLTGRLGYSPAAANRRIWAARFVSKFPKTLNLIKNRSLSLSSIELIHRIITPENREELLSKVLKKSYQQVSEIAALYKTADPIRDQMNPVGVCNQENSEGSTTDGGGCLSFEDGEAAKEEGYQSVNQQDNSTNQNSARDMEALQLKYKVQFEASKEFKEHFERVKALLWGKYPKGMNIEQVLMACMESFLEKHCPVERAKRREKKKVKSSVVKKDTTAPVKKTPLKKRSHIPLAIRDLVWMRDGARCSFTSKDGYRCNSKYDLEIDHIVPIAHGGGNNLENLSLKCRVHNIHAAEELMGKEFMDKQAFNNKKNLSIKERGYQT